MSWHNVNLTRPLGRVHNQHLPNCIQVYWDRTEARQNPMRAPFQFFLLSAPRVPVATCLSSRRCLWGWHARKCRRYWCLRRNMCGCLLPCNVNKANVCKQTATGRPNLSVKETKHCPAEIPSAGACVKASFAFPVLEEHAPERIQKRGALRGNPTTPMIT